MANLILMMGIPGSGKSTIAKKKLKETDLYISRDEIRFSILKPEDNYFSKENEVFEEFVKQIQAGIDNKEIKNVFADATHLNHGSRMKLLNKLNRFGIDTYILFINTPLEIALERNSKREGRALVPDNVIKNMHQSIEAPKKDENIKAMYIANEKGDILYKYQRKEDK